MWARLCDSHPGARDSRNLAHVFSCISVDPWPLSSSFFFVHSDLISVEGSIRVISDEFSISLLNPESEAYRFKEQKYSKMVN